MTYIIIRHNVTGNNKIMLSRTYNENDSSYGDDSPNEFSEKLYKFQNQSEKVVISSLTKCFDNIQIKKIDDVYIAFVSKISSLSAYFPDTTEYLIENADISEILGEIYLLGCDIPSSIQNKSFDELLAVDIWQPEISDLKNKEMTLTYWLSYEDDTKIHVENSFDLNELIEIARYEGALTSVPGNSATIAVGSVALFDNSTGLTDVGKKLVEGKKSELSFEY